MTTPIFDELVAERRAADEWVIDELRAPLDFDELIAKSYERVMVRAHLRRQIEKRARIKSRRRMRRVALP